MIVALPDLGAVAAALLLLLIAAALWVIIQLLVNTLGRAPLIGGWISGNLAGWLNDARNSILDASKATWHAAVDLFNWGNNVTVTAIARFIQFEGDASGAITRLLTVRLPDFLGMAGSYALSLYHSATGYALALEQQTVAWADARITAAEQAALGWFSQALGYAEQLFSRAEADAAALVTQAETDAANAITQASTALQADIYAAEQLAASDVGALSAWTQAAVGQLESDLTTGIQSAEALAFSQVTALGRGIVTDLEQAGDTAVGLAWPGAAGDIEALRQTLGQDFPWLNDLLGLLAGAGTAGLLGALIRSMATSHALTRLANDCIVPNCRNLSGLGSDLSNLAQLFSAGTIFAWLAEAVADPAAWAGDTNAVLAPVGAATVAAARGVFGAPSQAAGG